MPFFLKAEDEYERAPICYSETQPKDAAYDLEKQWKRGQGQIDRSSAWTILKGLMKQFHIPEESQVMVFSKTSKQNDRISPQKPRVVYFGDDAYVGYALGGAIEVSTIDSLLGPIFYPRSGNGRLLSCARAWFHKASSTRSGCVLGDTAREAKSLVESMTDANRRSAIHVLRFMCWIL